MKRRFIVLTTVLALTAGVIAGCGSTQEASQNVAQEVAQTEVTAEPTSAKGDKEEATETPVGMANPWVTVSEEEAQEACMRLFKAPDGATNQEWMVCQELGDASTGVGPLVQLSFSLDDRNFTARAQQGAAEDADIAGNYVDWTVGPEDCTLANWGGGNMTGKFYRAINETGYVDMITWYDMEIGIAYSLSVADKDLDGFDIQAIAERMYSAEAEADSFGSYPDDFVQEQAGVTSFASYDDVIAALKPGQGYAYIKLMGSDEELLVVTDLVFEYDHSACDASIYGKLDGKVSYLSSVHGAGSSYPLRVADGILYTGSNHTYETYFISQEYGGLMMKDSISDGVDFGTNEFSGFTREKNSFSAETADFTGGQEEFEKLLIEREKKPIIEFTAIQ